MKLPSPDYVVRDISKKCGNDVTETVMRNIMLVDGQMAISAVSLNAAITAATMAGGALSSIIDPHHKQTPEVLVDALLSLMRPELLRAARASEEMLRKAAL